MTDKALVDSAASVELVVQERSVIPAMQSQSVSLTLNNNNALKGSRVSNGHTSHPSAVDP